jgi:DNA primase catalytic subunit
LLTQWGFFIGKFTVWIDHHINPDGFQEKETLMDIEEMKVALAASNKALEDLKATGNDDEARKRLTHLESENKDLIAARDKAKERAREAEEKKLTDNQEFKTLADTRLTELDALKVEQANAVEKLTAYETREEARLVKLIEAVPEAQRPLIKDSFSLADRLELAESLAQTKPNPPTPRLPGEGGGKLTITRQTFDALSPADKSKHVASGGAIHD